MGVVKRSAIELADERPKRSTIGLTLRTQQADYLERVAESEETSLSQAFGSILEAMAGETDIPAKSPTWRVRKHLVIDPRHQDVLNRLAAKWGLSKSDVARRLIDQASAARGQMICIARNV